MKAQHERYVLDQEPIRRALRRPQESESFSYETGIAPVDTARQTDWAKVLAWETGGEEIYARETLDVPYIPDDSATESRLEHRAGARFDLAQELNVMTRVL